MRRFQVLMVIVSLALIVPVGHVLAFGPGAGYSGVKIAQISFIDRSLSLMQLSDGMELRAPDQRMLTDLRVGDWVKVDFFASDGAHAVINSVRPAQPDEISLRAPAMRDGIANRG
jgi:hypothetical protein